MLYEPLKAVVGSLLRRHHRMSIRLFRLSLNCLCSHAPTTLKGRRSRAQGASPGLGSSGRQALKGRRRLRRPFRATSKSRPKTQGLRPGLCCAAPAGLNFLPSPVAGAFKCSRPRGWISRSNSDHSSKTFRPVTPGTVILRQSSCKAGGHPEKSGSLSLYGRNVLLLRPSSGTFRQSETISPASSNPGPDPSLWVNT